MEIHPGGTVKRVNVIPESFYRGSMDSRQRHAGMTKFLWLTFAVLIIFLVLNPIVFASDIEGTIRVEGPVPIQPPIPVDARHVASCGREQISPSLLVSDGGFLQNAVVSLTPVILRPEGLPAGQAGPMDPDPRSFPPQNVGGAGRTDPTSLLAGASLRMTPPVLDQKNCHFIPHILLVPKNHAFQVSNSDPMAHDVRAFEGADMLFRFEMDAFAPPVEKKFENSGRFVIRCGLHKWMHAFAVVTENPFYAVTDEHGNFKLTGVPAGKYRLRIWHETLGEAEKEADLTSSVRDFAFTFPFDR